MDTADVSGTWIEWYVETDCDRTLICEFRYACASDTRSMDLSVNGSFVATLDFPATGAWTTWNIEEATVTIVPGFNAIRSTAVTSGGSPHMDKLDIVIRAYAL